MSLQAVIIFFTITIYSEFKINQDPALTLSHIVYSEIRFSVSWLNTTYLSAKLEND